MKLMIYTQCRENYGTEENPYWKMKGGYEYVVRNYTAGNAISAVQAAAAQREVDSPLFQEWVINFEVVEDDFLTEFEKNQLLYDGQILYPAKEIAI